MQNNLTVKLLEESNLDAKELEAARTKLNQLNESLSSFLTLHPQTPWPLILDKFNILITRYNQLLHEVSCKFLKECVIHPDSLPDIDPDSLPRFLLRTKFIPEIEEMESNLIVSIAGENNQINWIDETKITAEYEKWKAQIDQHDEIAEKSIDWFEIKQREYDFKRRIPLNEKRKRLRPELPRRRKNRASILKKKMLSSQNKSEASPLSQSLSITPTETEDSRSMMSETITDIGTVTDDESASSVMTESTNVIEEKDSDEDNTDDNMNSKATSKLNSGDEDSVITTATANTSFTSSTLVTLNSSASAFGSIYNPRKVKRSSTLRNEVDYNNDNESDYEDTYNYDDSSESSSESEKEDEKNKKKTDAHKHDTHKKQAPTIANIPEFSSTTAQEGILEKMICWLERGGEFKI